MGAAASALKENNLGLVSKDSEYVYLSLIPKAEEKRDRSILLFSEFIAPALIALPEKRSSEKGSEEKAEKEGVCCALLFTHGHSHRKKCILLVLVLASLFLIGITASLHASFSVLQEQLLARFFNNDHPRSGASH
jgi:hypothetical protein